MANTLDLLMAKAEQKENDKLKVKKIKSKCIGGEILLRKPPLAKVSSLIDEASEIDGFYEGLRNNAALVYEACPDIKNNFDKLKEAYGVADPYDLVLKIFDDYVEELNALAQEVLGFYGFGNLEEVKN